MVHIYVCLCCLKAKLSFMLQVTYLCYPALDFPILFEEQTATTNPLENQSEVRNANRPCNTLMCLVQTEPS